MTAWVLGMALGWASEAAPPGQGEGVASTTPEDERDAGTVPTEPHEKLPPRLEEVESVRPLELHAWAAVGYRGEVDGEGQVSGNPYVSLARVQTRVLEYGFGAFIQLGADNGQVELLDARSTWRPNKYFWLRGGRFKTPLSAEFLVPANHLLLPSRGAHVELVSRRALGAEMHVRIPVGEGLLLFQPGVFDPVGGVTPAVDVGQQAVGRVLWQTGVGVQLHAAGSAWVRDEGAADRLGELAPAHDRHLVGAILFEDHVWTAILEGVLARPTGRDERVWGATATLAKRFDTRWEGIEVEPVAAFEIVRDALGPHELGRVGLNIHHHDWRVVQMLSAEVDHQPGHTAVVGFLQLRAGM